MNLAGDDDEEDDELGNSDIREVYKQQQNNMRSFIVLRFRHFVTFSVVMAFIITVANQYTRARGEQIAIGTLGLFIILLFWMLDYRTGEYLKYHSTVATSIEKKFLDLEKRVNFNIPAYKKPRFLSATHATNLIFMTILLGWLGFFITQPKLQQREANAALDQPQSAGNAPSQQPHAAVRGSKGEIK